MIELKEISFSFKKNKPLFDNLNLQIKPANVYGLLGKNGAGKTTLLKIMNGLLFPDKGESLLFGDKAGKRLPENLSKVFFLAEDIYLPSIKLTEFVKVHAPLYPNFNHENLQYFLNELEVNDNKSLTSYSYGQKKKFLIAFGLATNTEFLLLDEPTNGLDIPSKSQFRKIIASSMNQNRSVVISTHQIKDLGSLIDNIIILESGKIIFNQNTLRISEKLVFDQVKEIDNSNLLYQEEIFGGYFTIRKRTSEESQIDLELLFNGVLKNASIINNEFKN